MDKPNYWAFPLPDAVSITSSDKDNSKSLYVLHYDWGLNKHQHKLPITLDTSNLLLHYITEGAKVDPDVRLTIAASIPELRTLYDRIQRKKKDQLEPEEIMVLLEKYNVDDSEFPAIHRN